MVTGMGEPGRVLLGADCRGGAGTGEPGAVLLGAAVERGHGLPGGGQKNKGKHRFVQAFFNPAYRR